MSKRKTPTDEVLKVEIKNGLNATSIGKKYKVSKVCVARHLVRLGLNQETPIGKSGKEHSQWKGGLVIKNGYPMKYEPKHSRRYKIPYVPMHVLVVEKMIGRTPKKTEPIHHIDLDRMNYNKSNLHLCKNNSEHQQLHASLDKVVSGLIKNGTIKFSKGRYLEML